MNVSQLRQSLAVVAQGTLGRASQVLNISQPALSKNIRCLEGNLGVGLLDGDPSGMVPRYTAGRWPITPAPCKPSSTDQ